MNSIRRALAVIALGVFVSILSMTGQSHSHQDARNTSAPTLSAPAPAPSPVRSLTPQQVSAEAFYHRVWELGRDNFLWQDRQQDWATWEHKFDGKLNSQTDAERAVDQLLGNLNDPYTYFKDAKVTASRGAASQRQSVVTFKMLPNDVGYIRIRTFGSMHEADELEAALKALPQAKSFVIDLRDNGGGYVWQAFRSFALLTDNGVFTTMKGRSGGSAYTEVLELRAKQLVDTENGKDSISSRPDNVAGDRPLVILVNGDTASASEMLTGALRDHGRAKVVGSLSFGKGIAQNTYELDGKTSVQITFAQYFFPSGVSIHKVGITPDTVIGRGLIGDAQMDEAERQAKDAQTK